MKVALVMGSDSDYQVLKSCIDTLKKFEIAIDVMVCSAHRTPDKASEFAKSAESSGIDASSETWYELEEGRIRTKDYIFYPEEGEILFHGTQKPISGKQNICLTYIWGQESTPVDIKRLATLITAKRTIQTIVGGSATNEGGSVSVGTISVSDPSEFGNRRLERMGTEIDRLFRVCGDMKTYRLNRVY